MVFELASFSEIILSKSQYFIFMFAYVFGCVSSQLQHVGSSPQAGSFCCDADCLGWLRAPAFMGSVFMHVDSVAPFPLPHVEC